MNEALLNAAALLWKQGLDTHAIAVRLLIRESVVYNHLHEIKPRSKVIAA
jgi:DNA-binding CsgD family transcriptional regulator